MFLSVRDGMGKDIIHSMTPDVADRLDDIKDVQKCIFKMD